MCLVPLVCLCVKNQFTNFLSVLSIAYQLSYSCVSVTPTLTSLSSLWFLMVLEGCDSKCVIVVPPAPRVPVEETVQAKREGMREELPDKGTASLPAVLANLLLILFLCPTLNSYTIWSCFNSVFSCWSCAVVLFTRPILILSLCCWC